MTLQECAYLAGLLDADGSIMLQFRKRNGMKFLFRIKTVVVFYQDAKKISVLHDLKQIIGCGYVYLRNDNMCELRIEGHSAVTEILSQLQPHIRFKHKQVAWMLEAVGILRKRKYSLIDFLKVSELSDQIAAANYHSSRRIHTAKYIASVLQKAGLIPVTTGSMN